jgi:hypothetical protein
MISAKANFMLDSIKLGVVDQNTCDSPGNDQRVSSKRGRGRLMPPPGNALPQIQRGQGVSGSVSSWAILERLRLRRRATAYAGHSWAGASAETGFHGVSHTTGRVTRDARLWDVWLWGWRHRGQEDTTPIERSSDQRRNPARWATATWSLTEASRTAYRPGNRTRRHAGGVGHRSWATDQLAHLGRWTPHPAHRSRRGPVSHEPCLWVMEGRDRSSAHVRHD